MDVAPKEMKAMTKEEVVLLIDLIQSNPILTSKETNATTNKSKDDSWSSVTCIFNAINGSIPRSKDQLKLKWDNLKKAARKRLQQIKMNNLKTDGDKPDSISHDEILDKVIGLLGSTCTVFVGQPDMDITKEQVKTLNDATNTLSNVPEDSEEEMTAETPPIETPSKKRKIDIGEGCSSSTHKLKYSFGMPMSKRLLRNKIGNKKADRVQASIISRNLAIASYYDKKREKLGLEIKLLRLELAQKVNYIFTNDDI